MRIKGRRRWSRLNLQGRSQIVVVAKTTPASRDRMNEGIQCTEVSRFNIYSSAFVELSL
jgi:hypothetical protein